MKLLRLDIQDEFRSLHKDFTIKFHDLAYESDNLGTFQPFCFAGLNGSGKSNVLEALASIFYHLEFCVAKFKPLSLEKHFKRHICTPNAFRLEYLIGKHDDNPYILPNFHKVIITKTSNGKKDVDNEPKMFIQEYPFEDENELKEISLIPSKNNNEAAEGKSYLPDLIVGYSSGENEILSLPFRKNRLVNYDKYREDFRKGIIFDEPETSLIYIDEGMSQAVLLAALLFEDEKTLKPLNKELGIIGLQSFTMNLNNHLFNQDEPHDVSPMRPILSHIEEKLNELKKCASTWYEQTLNSELPFEQRQSVISLDFFIDDATRKAFKEYFSTSFELFRFFQVLYELNSNIVSENIKEDVYSSKGFYTDGKLPIAAPQDTVFHFLDYKILKEVKGQEEPIPLLLREFSDGEHQFLHTIGICLMMKERRSLLLLDEPETHFNPSWRAKFIKILNDSITAGNLKGLPNGDFNVHLLKDVIITSHSPFIISDCMPDNVIFFKRNKDTLKVEAESAKEMDFNTYGTSVEVILDELFDYNQSIGDWSKQELLNIAFEKIKTEKDISEVKSKLRILGPSIEKDLVLTKLNRKLNIIKPKN